MKEIRWDELRELGKLNRKDETDAIKEFVNYAKSQGSKGADLYYANISKMKNSNLLGISCLDGHCARDIIDVFSLSAMQVADRIVALTLQQCMSKGMHYKDIYKNVRSKVQDLAKMLENG